MPVHKVRLPHFKRAAEEQTVNLPAPKTVTISMSQHIGVHCEPLVNVGDTVKIGQKIAESKASAMSAPIHSSVSGTVIAEKEITHISGKNIKALVIENDFRNEVLDSIAPPVINSREDFLQAVRDSGLVGLGGAGFPTSIKLGFDDKQYNPDVLIVNGAECEPYITADYRGFMENGEGVIDGVKLIMKWLSLPSAIIAIEDNKPKAIKKMKELTANESSITVKSLASRYPQGAEKTLIHSCTGRVVKEGQLPIREGCIVINSTTVTKLAEYVKTGMPLTSKRITVDGDIVNKPMNIEVPIGTSVQDIMDFVLGEGASPARIIAGGPMMGTCLVNTDDPIVKTGNALLFFDSADMREPTPCIKCGMCYKACPMNLVPTELEQCYDHNDAEGLIKHGVALCLNCGACSFACPAKRHLAEKNQLAKMVAREYSERMKAKKGGQS